jgi:hypothetical protein
MADAEVLTGRAVEFDVDDMPDIVFTPDPSKDADPLRCAEDGCLNQVVKPARGRTPKYCPEHQAAKRATTGTGRGRQASWAKAGEVESALNFLLTMVGGGLTAIPALAPDGRTVMATGPDIIRELVNLGRVDKTVRMWLERIAAPGKYGPLMFATLPLVIGIMANHNLLPQFVVNLTGDNNPSQGETTGGGEFTA